MIASQGNHTQLWISKCSMCLKRILADRRKKGREKILQSYKNLWLIAFELSMQGFRFPPSHLIGTERGATQKWISPIPDRTLPNIRALKARRSEFSKDIEIVERRTMRLWKCPVRPWAARWTNAFFFIQRAGPKCLPIPKAVSPSASSRNTDCLVLRQEYRIVHSLSTSILPRSTRL